VVFAAGSRRVDVLVIIVLSRVKKVANWRLKPKSPSDKKETSGRPEAVRIKLLGNFHVTVGSRSIGRNEWRLRKAASLVKLLALAPGHRLHREQVMDALWPDLGMRAASNNLRQTLHFVRRTLDPAAGSRYLASQDESIVLCPESSLWVDVEAFEEAARSARRSHQPTAYEAAIDLYAGELLPADRYEGWVEERRQRLRVTYLSLLLTLARLWDTDHHSGEPWVMYAGTPYEHVMIPVEEES
jgi:DNA-binding SARP family transcriptional activator